MTAAQRPPAAYIHGVDSAVVVIPARVCAWLERHAQLNLVRVQNRGADAEVDAVLVALRLAALTWRTSATGSPAAAKPEEPTQSKNWYSTSEAAERLGVTDRAVRLAIQEKRLNATSISGRWRISLEDIQHFNAGKTAQAA